jgi:hypothetical protein
MFKITKSLNNNYVLSLRDAYGTRQIAQIATPAELIEAREWVNKFYEGDCKIKALKDLTPQVLKYKNGAVVHAPKEDTSYWFVASDFDLIPTRYDEGFGDTDIKRLQNKSVFLSKGEAKAYVEKVKIYNKLEKQIIIINHEHDWVADWSDGEQEKYYIIYTYATNKYQSVCVTYNQVTAYHMSEQAINWLLSDEVSDNERKIWIDGL